MPRVDLELSIEVERTPRVMQLEGMFDVPEAKRRTVSFHFDVPIDANDWNVGLIVGPSGAGKSVCARHLFGDAIVEHYDWHPTRSIVDSFGDLSIRDVTGALSSVGFASPPSWTKPFRVLSNGEQFRATMARALMDERDLVVIDEFTSVVDRTVARVGSHAVAKSIRAKGKRFVAVSCHDDIVEWLQPDWILEPHIGRFERRSLRRRPTLDMEIVRCDRDSSWGWFAPHHYLTAELHRAARCFVGIIEGRPVAFAAVIPMPHPRRSDLSSLSRLVVAPDFQGLGLGAYAFTEAIAAITLTNGRTLLTHPTHPALVKTWAKSPLWDLTSHGIMRAAKDTARTSTVNPEMMQRHARDRRVAHFKWCGPSWPDVEGARRLWENTKN